MITLVHPSGSSASVTRHGAQVLHWRDTEGRDRLYLSSLASFDEGAAIRGGIPVIFPQFGTGPLPKHGLVRTRPWTVTSHGTSSAKLVITDDDDTRALWPYRFRLELDVELSERLTMRLTVTNTGDSAFSFTAALHNYLHVDDVRVANVQGLDGVTYADKTRDGKLAVETERALIITGETDRVYMSAPRRVMVDAARGSSATTLESVTFGDWVVWNPWRDNALTDMQSEDYLCMLCVEAACVGEPVTLTPAQSWTGTEILGAT